VDERAKWEQRYRQAAEQPFYGREPSPFVVRALPLLPAPGRCLDVAGGEGRNALFLAARGWQVTLVDVAVAGVATARRRAAQECRPLALVVADTDHWPLCPGAARWDLILVVNYHSRALVAAAATMLRPGGALLVEGFAREQLGRSSGGPQDPELLWRPNELIELVAFPGGGAPSLRVVWYEDRLVSGDDSPRHRGPKWVVRLVARRG
jgi:SAM-dependent methyltransferase